MPRNDHKSIEDREIHVPKGFVSASDGDSPQRNLNGELIWVGSPWQPNTINVVDINSPPPTENNGDRYIVIYVASTVADAGWDGAVVDDVVEFSSTTTVWGKRSPQKGDITYNETLEDYYQYDGTEWIVLISGGGGGSITINWKFSTTITDADPGSGNFRMNNATQGSATQLFVSDFSDGGTDVSAILDSVKIGTDIYLQQGDDSTRYHVVTVNGVPTDATTYWKIPITISDSGADLQNNKTCPFIFIGAGADFADGGEAGGADRTLGNTDNFDLGLKTNNNIRLQVQNDGNIGIGTETPSRLLVVEDSSVDDFAQVKIYNSSTGDAGLEIRADSQSFYLAIDNSDSNKLMLKTGLTVGSGTGLTFDPIPGLMGVGLNSSPLNPIHLGYSSGSLYSAITPGSNSDGVQFENTSSTIGAYSGVKLTVDDAEAHICFERLAADEGTLHFKVDNSGTAMSITDDNFVGIGTTTPSCTLELHSDAGSQSKLCLSDGDVTTGFTTLENTDVYMVLEPLSTIQGGAKLTGYSEGDKNGLIIVGAIGSTNPTDTTAAVQFRAAKQSGTTITALGSLETAYQFSTYNGTTDWLTILGSGNTGIGTVSPTETLHVVGNVKVVGQYIPTVATLSDAANIATDTDLGNVFRVTITANRVFDNPTNMQDGATYTWYIKEDGSGGHTPTFGSKFDFGDDVPTFNTGIGKMNIIVGMYDGTEDTIYAGGKTGYL